MESLSNFIKYCLGYIKLTRERAIILQQRYSVGLSEKYFSLIGLLNGDLDGKLSELINLENFYSYDPKEIPKDKEEQYEKEKELANKINDIYSKYRNDQFTKQIIFSFGYFEIELPIETNGDNFDIDSEEQEEIKKIKINRYPLFSLPVRIEKEISKGAGKYYVYTIDPEIQVNVGILETILGDDLYFPLLEEIGKYEINGKLTLPITNLEIFIEIWDKIKAQLRLKKVGFDQKSFSLEEMQIALSPRSNYFLAEDLAKLSKLSEEELSKTALTSWTQVDELTIEANEPYEKDLFFPFLYDKYQLSTLSILGNKASIIQGPPGTGKSETISNILCHLAATGNKILFVSQKAQALKVVKDKLKKLNIKYLYGYLPNPSSSQIGEEDEADGIAPQLSALSSHIDKLGYKQDTEKSILPLDEIIENKNKYRSSLNEIIEKQRELYTLSQELVAIKEYDIDITDLDRFSENFSSAEWSEIKNIKGDLESIVKNIEIYEKTSEKEKLDRLFFSISFRNRNFCHVIKGLRDDIAKTGFDRHSNFLRSFNNFRRKLRLNRLLVELPREIIDYINEILKKDLSRNEQIEIFNSLYNHSCYYESQDKLENVKQKLKEKLAFCGVSDEEFEIINKKIDEFSLADLDEIKIKILRIQELKKEIKKLSKTKDLNNISLILKNLEEERAQRIGTYIQNIINKDIIKKWKSGITTKQIVAKLARAFGKSKKAFKTFDNLRKDSKNFNAILDLIPIWIMELDDASRIIPLESGIFDYVILDEASQCNVAYTLPVMYRTNRVLFVGDSEQMRDSTIRFKSNKQFDDLAIKYQIPEERQIKSTGNAVQSVLDIAELRGFMSKQLKYHYRSPAELIGFSNDFFYIPKGKEVIPLNSNYITYKDTNRVMLIHEIKSDWNEEVSDSINVAEAKAILELFKEIRSDERYREKSIAILSFFNAQATYIRDLFVKNDLREEDDNYKVSIIEGIQGDEKDIVIYSFVIRNLNQKNKYVPLTGEGGDILADINKGRVNVAFSRARQQVHCFVSLPPNEMPEKIWLKKYLEYVQRNGEINFFSTNLKPFDSYFEEEFYNLAHNKFKKGYKIQNQVESCGFKIDFVMSNLANGKRLAIECDGPCHFKDELDEANGIHIESDEERQRILEAAGWRFYRIKYCDWIEESFDKNSILTEILELLK